MLLANITFIVLGELPRLYLVEIKISLICIITLDSLIKNKTWHVEKACDYKPILTIVYLSAMTVIDLGGVDSLKLIYNLLLFCK